MSSKYSFPFRVFNYIFVITYFIFLTSVTDATSLTFPRFFQTKIILLPVGIVKLLMGEVAEGRSILRPSTTSPTLWS